MDDAQDLFEIRKDAEVNQYIERKAYEEFNQATEFIDNLHEKMPKGEWFVLGVEDSKSGKLIGTVCLFGFNQDRTVGELGYELSPSYQGKGIMTETLELFLNWIKEQHLAQKLNACIHAENEASKRLIQKLGFVLDATVEKIPEGFNGWSKSLV
jgi:ribosomal-protein-alanine N-acetyltransferase